MKLDIRTPQNFNPQHFCGSITYEDIQAGIVLTYERSGFELNSFQRELREIAADKNCWLIGYGIEQLRTNVAKFTHGLREGLVD
jgi:hypothetical protein